MEYMVNPKAIGEKLRKLRAGRTLEEISDATGIGRSALNMYELGLRVPRDETKITLACYFGVPVEDLFYTQDATNSGENETA